MSTFNEEQKKKLKDLGVEYVDVAKEFTDKHLPEEEVNKLIELAKNLKEGKTNNNNE